MSGALAPGEGLAVARKASLSPARREFSRAQKVAMIKLGMTRAGQIICEGCGLNVTGKVIEFDHIVPEALILDKSTDLDMADGCVLGHVTQEAFSKKLS